MAAKKSSDKPWQQTSLYQRLYWLAKKRDRAADTAKFILRQVDGCMEPIQTLLGHDTTPKDYSLHDDQHAFRVAERMEQITAHSAWQSFSPQELALLLFSAYLHDIGMSPGIDQIQRHHDWLCYGETGGPHLAEDEANAFRAWLDDHHRDLSVPFPRNHPSHDERARRILSAYAREQHNDWSAHWIRTSGVIGEYLLYHGFRQDLIQLCASHHWDIEKVRCSDDLRPRAVPHDGQTFPLDLRYLACLLRMADILENDPERTPPILYTHRDIIPSSQLYWQRDHHLTVEVSGKPNAGGHLDLRVRCHAHCPSAVIEKAARDLREAISAELEGCDYLSAQPDSAFGRIPGMKDLNRPWILPRRAAFTPPDAKPYEYIDGTFRPDTAALLRLVAGEALYGTPLAAVRELLQNAFDAVREKVAIKRLALTPEQNPADSKWEEELGNQESVSLRLERRADGRLYLICTDTGTGMTRDIISRRLLISGQAPGHPHLELERHCRKKGFSTGRTARFGIGCLSYFMLADEVTIITRRDQLCNDSGGEVWQFRTTGTAEFGELRQLQHKDHPPGTTVEWMLKEQASLKGKELWAFLSNGGLIPADGEFNEALSGYLERKVLTIPSCLKLDLGNEEQTIRQTGWFERIPSDSFWIKSIGSCDENSPCVFQTYPEERTAAALWKSACRIDDSEDGEYFAMDDYLRYESMTNQLPQICRVRVTASWVCFKNETSMGWRSSHEVGRLWVFRYLRMRRPQGAGYIGMTCGVNGRSLHDSSRLKASSDRGQKVPGMDDLHGIDLRSLGNFDVDIDLFSKDSEITVSRDSVFIPETMMEQIHAHGLVTIRRLAAKLRAEYPGTTLAVQMEELEEWFKKQEAGG